MWDDTVGMTQTSHSLQGVHYAPPAVSWIITPKKKTDGTSDLSPGSAHLQLQWNEWFKCFIKILSCLPSVDIVNVKFWRLFH